MADQEDAVPKNVKSNKKRGLPPISPRNNTETDVKAVRRKPKKKAADEGNGEISRSRSPVNVSEDKPVPRRRRKRSPSQTQHVEEGEPVVTDAAAAPKKKKKKKPKSPTSEDADKNQSADTQPKQNGQGSKTSLITKEGDTPRKKVVKKKKKVKKTTLDEDEYGDSPWAEDLRTMQDDIISDGGHDEEEGQNEDETTVPGTKKLSTMFVTAPILKSQPLEKIFIETSSKFKGQNKSTLDRKRAEEATTVSLPAEVSRLTTSDFAIGSNKIFRIVTLFLHGLTAGLALWQMVTIFTLSTFPSDEFLQHYYRTAMPLQGCLYFLLAVCTVSVCDRFDIGNPTRRFVLRAVTMQNGAISIVFCLVSLVLNLIAIRYEDRMSLYQDYLDLYSNDSVTINSTPIMRPEFMKAEEISTFRSINAARSIFIVLSWFVLSITPNADRLGKSLRSGKTGLERELEMDRVSSA